MSEFTPTENQARYLASIHEAGHCVLGIVLKGISVDGATLVEGGTGYSTGGVTTFGLPKPRLFAYCLFLLGGYSSEIFLANGHQFSEQVSQGAAEDLATVADSYSLSAYSDATREALQRELYEAARLLVTHYRNAILAVAEYLYQHGAITGKRARELTLMYRPRRTLRPLKEWMKAAYR